MSYFIEGVFKNHPSKLHFDVAYLATEVTKISKLHIPKTGTC